MNDIRGLVTEAANTGALSPDQIAANQLQLDSSLEALNRIAQTTTFQGRRLLDGSLDFITTAGTGFSTVANLKIDQANLGSTGQVAVNINISAAATRAQIVNTAVPAGSGGGVQAAGTLTFTDAPRLVRRNGRHHGGLHSGGSSQRHVHDQCRDRSAVHGYVGRAYQRRYTDRVRSDRRYR